jgi:hypothetical protein
VRYPFKESEEVTRFLQQKLFQIWKDDNSNYHVGKLRKLNVQEKISRSRLEAYPALPKFEPGKSSESELLCHVPQFTEREWSLLSAGANKLNFEQGSIILAKGAPYTYLARLESGRVRVESEIRKKRELVEVVEAGEFFFMGALMTDPEVCNPSFPIFSPNLYPRKNLGGKI